MFDTMFELFGKSNYKIPKSEPLWKSGPEPVETNTSTFKVGVTVDGKTTLSLVCKGVSTTLTMNQKTCEQLIRLLQSTLTDEKETQNADAQ